MVVTEAYGSYCGLSVIHANKQNISGTLVSDFVLTPEMLGLIRIINIRVIT